MRRTGWCTAALLSAALLGACSPPAHGPRTTNTGGEVVSLPPPVSVQSVESTVDDTPTQTGVRGGTVDPAEAKFCERMQAYLDASDFSLGTDDPSVAPPTREAFEALVTNLKAMRSVASGDVQAAIDTYGGAIERLLGLLRPHGYDLEAALKSSDADKIRAVVDDPKVIDADRTLNDAAATVCGIVRT